VPDLCFHGTVIPNKREMSGFQRRIGENLFGGRGEEWNKSDQGFAFDEG